jgi:hypothetical protein
MIRFRSLLPLLALLLLPRIAAAQAVAPSLEAFVTSVARHWSAAGASELVGLAPEDGRILLDLGADGAGSVQERHVAAALRDLFRERETVSIRPTQVTLAGGAPLRGFGELSWVSRQRGVTRPVVSTVYVGAVYEGTAWRIRELRVLR